jgi:hypothetical protein
MSKLSRIPMQYETHIARMNLVVTVLNRYGMDSMARPGISQYAVTCALHKYHENKKLLRAIRYGRKIIKALVRIEGELE